MTSPPLLAGRYQVRERLGRGGMGEVWLGFDTVLRREVAVKTVDLGAADDAVTRERFQREALATAALSHPNVVTVFDAGIDATTAYLVMELLAGPTLAALVAERGALPIDDCVAWARQAAAGLAAAHRVGVIHRDVKPGNLMLDGSGRLKVVDFGIARLAQASAARLTATDTTLGSAAYMAPEQARGAAATEATDVYALGCVLTTLLTGHPPFAAEHPMGVMQQHLSDAPPSVRARRPEVPPALDRLVAGMLAKDPTHRPPDAAAALAALESLNDDGAAAASGGTAVLTAAVPPPTAPFATPATPSPSSSPPPGRRWAGWAVAAALVLLVGVGWLIVASAGDDDPADASGARGDRQRQSGQAADPAASTPAPDPADTGGPAGPVDPGGPSTPVEETVDPDALAASVADLRGAVESALAEGPGGHEADKLLKDLEKVEESASGDDPERVSRDLDHLQKSVEHAVDKGEVSETGGASVLDAIDGVRATLA